MRDYLRHIVEDADQCVDQEDQTTTKWKVTQECVEPLIKEMVCSTQADWEEFN